MSRQTRIGTDDNGLDAQVAASLGETSEVGAFADDDLVPVVDQTQQGGRAPAGRSLSEAEKHALRSGWNQS